MRSSIVIACSVALAAQLACKSRDRPRYDLGSPEKAVAAFFDAMNKKRIPTDIPYLLSTPALAKEWQFRCRRGCSDASFKIVRSQAKTPSRHVVYVDFSLRTGDGRRLTRKAEPIIVDKLGDQWLIGEIGERTVKHTGAKPRQKSTSDAAP